MVRQEQAGGPAFTGSFADLLKITGGQPGDPARRQAAADNAKAQADAKAKRDAYLLELRETAWGLQHLSSPFAYASEKMSIRESVQGIGTPVSDTAAEKRQHLAQRQNAVRRTVRDAFRQGSTHAEIAGQLSGMAAGDDSSIPRDIAEHYGYQRQAPRAGQATPPPNDPVGLVLWIARGGH
jgi:hypothetical protein